MIEVADIGVGRPIIQTHMAWQLDQAALLGLHDIGDFVTLERGIVEKSFLYQQIGCVDRDAVPGRAVPARPFAGMLLDYFNTAAEPILLLLARQRIRSLMDVTMEAYLMPILDHRI